MSNNWAVMDVTDCFEIGYPLSKEDAIALCKEMRELNKDTQYYALMLDNEGCVLDKVCFDSWNEEIRQKQMAKEQTDAVRRWGLI